MVLTQKVLHSYNWKKAAEETDFQELSFSDKKYMICFK